MTSLSKLVPVAAHNHAEAQPGHGTTANSDAFRTAMRRVIAGVTVITTRHDGKPWGMTVSAFTPVCMEPPTLLVCVNSKTVTADDIQRDRRFAVNVLSQSQREVSKICSRPGEQKFLDAHVIDEAEVVARTSMPVLRESLVTFDCRVADLMLSGTHIIAIASVEAVVAPDDLEPLLYGQGRYLRGLSVE
jgi:flavin reductase (DIM6/NTAB) family NADH-FMN oxidoreductase RutF